MKLINKSNGGLVLVNVISDQIYLAPKTSIVFPNDQLLKDYHKILSLFSSILDYDLSIEKEEDKEIKKEDKKDVVENKETTLEDNKSTKPKKVKKEK